MIFFLSLDSIAILDKNVSCSTPQKKAFQPGVHYQHICWTFPSLNSWLSKCPTNNLCETSHIECWRCDSFKSYLAFYFLNELFDINAHLCTIFNVDTLWCKFTGSSKCGGTCLRATMLHFSFVHPVPHTAPTPFILSYFYYVFVSCHCFESMLFIIGQINNNNDNGRRGNI